MTSSPVDSVYITPVNKVVLPRPPALASYAAGWESLLLVLYHQPPHAIPEFSSPYHTVCINYGSSVDVELTVDGQSKAKTSVPGDMHIFPAYAWQGFRWHQELSSLQLYLEPQLLTQAGIDLYGKDCIELVPQLNSCCDPLVYQMAIALKTTLEVEGLGSRLYADAMAHALAAHLLCRYTSRKPTLKQDSSGLSEKKLRQVKTYIQEHLEQELSLVELATLVQLSPYHFARLFKQATGVAPHRYHIQCRVDRAKHLLRQQDLTIAEVAYVVGFASQGHLNYHFKRLVGVTPRTFLRQ